MAARYGLEKVDRPPVPQPKPKTRKSALMKAVEEAAQEPGSWFCVASYDNRTTAYGSARRMRERDWDWPVVFWPVGDETGSKLYVKVLVQKEESE